jgi:type I restriction enzyme S subunit
MPLIPEYVNMKFIYNYLDTYKEFFFVDKMKGAANVSLKISSIKETPIPCIPIEIQNKYEELIKFCDNLEASIKERQQQNELLLQQVLREALEPRN